MSQAANHESDPRALPRRDADGGDEAAFATLVGEFKGLVYSTALRGSDSPQAAEELKQTVFAIVARKAQALLDYRVIQLKPQASLPDEDASRTGMSDQPQILPITAANPPVVEVTRIHVENEPKASGGTPLAQRAAKLIAEAECFVNQASRRRGTGRKLAS